MQIAFLGDIHGRVFHTLAMCGKLQSSKRYSIDAFIQLGDTGFFPDLDKIDNATRKFSSSDPTELDFHKLLNLSGKESRSIKVLKERMGAHVRFIRGNHEDMEWLKEREADDNRPIFVDPFSIFEYIPDGTIDKYGELKIGFMGGCEDNSDSLKAFDPDAMERLIHNKQNIDILFTHVPPYGVGVGYCGKTQGSKKITELLQIIRPKYHFFGHLHCTLGPFKIESTISVGTGQLMRPARNNAEYDIIPGCICILDTNQNQIFFPFEEWFFKYNRRMTLEELVAV
jgi:Icc-related predicted phosphoesterase